jgi:anti-sigma factor RsiW
VGGRIVDLLSGPHQTTEALLPWLLNGTLTGDERNAVEQHLQSCAQCRAELARQRELMNLYVAAGSVEQPVDVDAAFSEVRSRIAAEPRRPSRVPLTPLAWWRLGFGVQTAVVLLLGTTLLLTVPDWFSDDAATYRGLGSTHRANGDALVVFDPAASEARVRGALQQAGARIIDGPTAAGAYVVRFDVQPSTALAALRGDAAVIRVESLVAAR